MLEQRNLSYDQAWSQLQRSQLSMMERRPVLDTVADGFVDEDAHGWQQVVISNPPAIYRDRPTQDGLERMRAGLERLFEGTFLSTQILDLSGAEVSEILRAS